MIPLIPCGEDASPCCTSLYDIATHLLTEVFDSITACFTDENCGPIAAYVTLGNGDDGITDALTVAISDVRSAPSTSGRGGVFSIWQSTFTIVLRESGWPVAHVEGEAITLPSPVLQAAAATHVYAMGEIMHRKLASMQADNMLVPDSVRCSNASIGQMRPLNPRGGVVGWEIPVVVTLPWN